MSPKKKNVDPLYQLFEHYLLNRSYDDSAKFTKEVAGIYLAYLDSSPAHIPFHARQNVQEDLEGEAHELLVKKMYGCVKMDDHLNFGKVVRVKAKELEAIEFVPPAPVEEATKKE